MEKEMATHSSILAWRIPWTEEPGGLHTVHGVAKSRTRLSDFTSLSDGKEDGQTAVSLRPQVPPTKPHHPEKAGTECTPSATYVRPGTRTRHPLPGTPLRGAASTIPARPITSFPQQQWLVRGASAGSVSAHQGPSQRPEVSVLHAAKVGGSGAGCSGFSSHSVTDKIDLEKKMAKILSYTFVVPPPPGGEPQEDCWAHDSI